MSVVIFILKVLLMILLGLLGVIVTLILMVLILPIAYEAEGSYEEELWIRGKVKVFYILKVLFEMKGDRADTVITLFGKEILKQKEEDFPQEVLEPVGEDKVLQPEVVATPNQRANTQQVELLSAKMPEHTSEEPKPKKSKAKKSKPITKTKKKIGQSIKEGHEMVKELWTDEHRKPFFRAIRKLLGQLWRAIRPSRCRFSLRVGKENPDETGQLLAGLAFLFPFYSKYGTIIGDFQNAGIWGEAFLKGKFTIFRLLKPVITFVLNRSVRAYIHFILNQRKEEKHGDKT
ncbi:MAG: hypothetical protein ACRCTE_09780 [Cellulosilyticaceae bacterium]